MAYIIYENEQPMDGEIHHSKATLFRAIGSAEVGAKIIELDLTEVCQGGASIARDVTEDMVWEAYRAGHVFMEACWHKLPGRFIDQMETADDVAERQRDAMLAEVA